MRSIPIAFASITILCTAAPVSALPTRDSVTITYSPAELSTPQGMSRLRHRIDAAIEQVCGSYAAIETSQVLDMDDCWQSARASAESQLGGRVASRGEIKLARR